MTLALTPCGALADNGSETEPPTFVKSEKLEFEILQVGFCTLSQTWYLERTGSRKIDGKNYELTEYIEQEYHANDEEHILFVIKAHIKNISDHSLIVADDLNGYISFIGKEGKAFAQTFPFQSLSSHKSNTLRKGEDTDALCISWLPIEYYKEYEGCTYELLDISVDFGKNVEFTESIKFEMPKDELVEVENSGSGNSARLGVPLSYTYIRLPNGNLARLFYDFEMDRSDIESELEITECLAAKEGSNIRLAVSIKNLSDSYLPVAIIGYQLLDEAGDALYSGQIVLDGIDAHGSKIGSVLIPDFSYADFSAVRLVDYSVASILIGNDLYLDHSVNFSEKNVYSK